MLDTTPRVTFRVDDATYAQVCALAQRHGESLSQLCRDALALLIAHPQAYYDVLNSRLLARCKPPSAEQAAASEKLIDASMAIDLSAIFLRDKLPPS
jgi:hypothetical protein